MDLAEDLYREELMEHYHNPKNRGRIENADVKYYDHNPVCGDEVEIFLTIKDGVIQEAKFDGHGCAISQAAASILTENLKGKTTTEVLKLSNDDMLEMLPIEITNLRIKCALLTLMAVKKGIANE